MTMTHAAPTPESLDRLDRYGILDTAPEAGHDDIVRLAGRLCATPIALVSLVARDRQWFKARLNFASCETDLDRSICVHALAEPDLLVIPDLTRDPRTVANPLVTGEPGLRFYAGAPLRTADGIAIGSLCVIDTVPRPAGLTAEQADDLRALARQVMSLLDLHAAGRRLEDEQAYWRGLFAQMKEGFLVGEVVRGPDGSVVDWRYRDVNAAWSELLGLPAADVVGRTVREVIPGIEDAWIADGARAVETGASPTFTRQVGPLGRWYEGRSFRIDSDTFAVIFLEVTERVAAERRREALLALGDQLRDLGSVAAMTRAAAEIAGRTLDASRAGFGRLDAEAETIEVEPDWTVEGVASIAGRHRFDDYGDLRRELLRGDALVIDDVTTDPRTAADPSALLGVGIAALVNMPVRERGRTVAVFIVHDTRPRHWTPEVLAFLRNVADRLEVGVARLQAEEQQRVLNTELSHRLKNTLTMVQAIATQTLRTIVEREPILAFEKRLHALATAHDVLLEQNWISAPMRAVVSAVLDTFGQPGRFAIAGGEVTLGPRATMSLSLLMHELATNAFKYGALSNATGTVHVTWRRTGSGLEGDLFLTWNEVGGPPVREPNRKGFGSRLIRMGLVGTGGVVLRYPESGFQAEMSAPLVELQHS